MKNQGRFWNHALFWSIYWLVLSLYGGLYDMDFATNACHILLDLPLTIGLTYLFVYRILPLYFQKHWLRFGLASVFAMGAALLAKRCFIQYVEFPWLYAESSYTFTFFNWYKLAGHFVELSATAGFVAGLKHYRDWQRTKDKVVALNAEKREAELSFLRAQVHPHFLFNTLNSIYYEVLRKSQHAPDLIIRLSDILRFTLYECKGESIPIAKEIALIQNYIALEQCRYGDRLTVALRVAGNRDCLIPPMVCFSLVENAFKHGTADHTGPCHIEIKIDIGAARLRLEIRNPIAVALQPDTLGASKGIGLHNITQQLELIFEGRYSLQCAPSGDQFVSTLDMPLHTMRP